MTNIVVLVHNRYALTRQCIQSIRANTKPGTYTLTIVNDDSQDFRVDAYLIEEMRKHPKDTTLFKFYNSGHCLGMLKNMGVWYGHARFHKNDPGYICVLDNDVCVFKGWLEKMIDTMETQQVRLLGGVRHPFHGVNKQHEGWVEVDAVAGYCHLIRFETFIIEGPYVEDAPGIGQSED